MRTEDYDLRVIIDENPIEEFIEESTNTTWIPAQKGKGFKLLIFNNGDRRVLAVPLIDGLSVMDGKSGSIHSSNGYILNSHKGGAILGWRIDNETVSAFTFDSAEKSLASFAKGDHRDIGVIQCAIYREKQYPKLRPKLVPLKQKEARISSEAQYSVQSIGDYGGRFYKTPSPQKNIPPSATIQHRRSQLEENETLAVGFGAAITSHIKKVSFTRESESPLCVLTIRYESSINFAKRRNLLISKTEYCKQWLKYGFEAIKSNSMDEGVAALMRVVKVSPDLEQAWEGLIFAYETTDNFKMLAHATNNLARLRYNDAKLWRKLGLLYINHECWEETIEPFDKYNALEPESADSWNCLGMGLVKTGQVDEAWYCCDKALQIDPKFSDAWDTLGIVHLQTMHMDDAVKAFSNAVDLDPTNDEAWSNLWSTYSKMHRKKDAVRVLDRLRKVNPQLANSMRYPT